MGKFRRFLVPAYLVMFLMSHVHIYDRRQEFGVPEERLYGEAWEEGRSEGGWGGGGWEGHSLSHGSDSGGLHGEEQHYQV